MTAPTIVPMGVPPPLTLVVLSVNNNIIHSYISWDPPTATNMNHVYYSWLRNTIFMAFYIKLPLAQFEMAMGLYILISTMNN